MFKLGKKIWRSVGIALLAATALIMGASPVFAASVTYSGNAAGPGSTSRVPNIAAGVQNTSFNTCSNGPYDYAVVPFTVDTAGTYTATSTTPTVENTTFFLSGTFSPSTTACAPSVYSRFLVSVYSGTIVPHTSTFNGTGLALQAGVQYSVLVAFNHNGTGSEPFTLTMNGPGCIAMGNNTCAKAANAATNPSSDQEVIGLSTSQVDAAKRFASTQSSNFQTHLEGLHRRKQAPRETSASASGDTPSGNQARNAMGAENPAAAGDPRPTSPVRPASPASPNLGENMRMDPLALPETKSAGASSLPWSALRLDGTQQNLLGTNLNLWSAGVVNLGKQGNTDTSFSTTGVSIGADKRYSDSLALGIGAGFGHAREKIGGNGTRNTGDNYVLTAYGSYQPADGFFIDGLLGYGHLSFDALRYVTATGGVAASARKGSQWFSSLSGGYEFEYAYKNATLLISPYTRLDLASTRLDQTTESGADQYNLAYSAQNIPTTRLALGLRGETSFKLKSGTTAKPYVRLEYQHDFEKSGVAEMRFANQLGGPVYQLDSASSTRNTSLLGVGSKYLFRKSLALDFYYQFSYSAASNTRINTLVVNLSKTF